MKKITIAISGPAGSGKTTYAKFIAKEFNLRYFSAGEIFRRLAKEKGLSLSEFSKQAEKDYEIDRMIDNTTLNEARRGNVVLDGRLTAWVAREIADLKILVTAPLEVRVRRIAKRDGISYKQAYKETLERELSELKRYKEIYGAEPFDPKIYDVMINTEKFSIESVLKILKTVIEEYLASQKVR
ncbi:MAG: (d)CMP kinase [Candidatus Baldrarchaeia archaeon]